MPRIRILDCKTHELVCFATVLRGGTRPDDVICAHHDFVPDEALRLLCAIRNGETEGLCKGFFWCIDEPGLDE